MLVSRVVDIVFIDDGLMRASCRKKPKAIFYRDNYILEKSK